MKKHFLILCLCAGLALASCSGSNSSDTADDSVSTSVDTTGMEPNPGMDTLNGGSGDTIMNNKTPDGATSTGAGDNTGATPGAGGETNSQSARPADVDNSNSADGGQ